MRYIVLPVFDTEDGDFGRRPKYAVFEINSNGAVACFGDETHENEADGHDEAAGFFSDETDDSARFEEEDEE
jgi:hypothetical protein